MNRIAVATLPLKDLCTKIRGGGTPRSSTPGNYQGRIPFVKIDDMTRTEKYLVEAKAHISDFALHSSSAWLIPENALIYSIYATLGEVRILKRSVATNQAILGMIIDQSKADVEYIYYYLASLRPKIHQYSKQGTQSNLTKEIVENLMIRLPAIDVQRRIAAILSAADKSIAATEAVIEAKKKLRLGLIQNLLSESNL